MQIVCSHCSKRFQIPPEKVPARRFSFPCPKCGQKIKVDPVRTEQLEVSELRPPAPSGPVEIALDAARTAEAPAVAATIDEPLAPAEPLPPVSPIASGLHLPAADRTLLSTFSTTALVVNLEGTPEAEIHRGLRGIGMQEIHEMFDLETALESLQTYEAGIVLVRMGKAPPPPCEPLAPLHRLSPDLRRRIFVALLADNVSSLNGQVAFLLQVDCLISSQDLPRLSQLLLRALLHQLRLYRHWNHDRD